MEAKETWIKWFLSQPRGKYYVELDKEFLSTSLNYYGIKQKVNKFFAALELISKSHVIELYADMKKDNDSIVVGQQAELLYGLLHSRYILTEKGLEKIAQKYKNKEFPCCPRLLCHDCTCLPYGISQNPNEYPLMMFCPCCGDVYTVKSPEVQKIDGAFFGPSYVHLFVNKYKDILPPESKEQYVQKIYGIKVSKQSLEFPDEDSTTT